MLSSRFKKLIILILISYISFSYVYYKITSYLADQSPAFNQIIPEVEVNYVERKYIQNVCDAPNRVCGGWADRLKGVFSTYALSMILNRTFLINITQPCYLNTIIRPNLVNWDEKGSDPFWEPSSTFDFNIQYDYAIIKKFETIDVVEYFKQMDGYQLINVHSSTMFSDAFSVNSLLRERLKQLGYHDQSKFRLYLQMRRWYNELFKLPENLEEKYQKIKARIKPNPKTFVICAQIRTGATTSKGQDDPFFTDRGTVTTKFYSFINKTFLHQLDKYTNEVDNYRIYVTADFDGAKAAAIKAFDKRKVVFNEDQTVHMDRDHSNLQNSCGDVGTVIVDFHTLQLCDASVVSHSGFGLLGNWNRKEPLKNLYAFTKPNPEDMKKSYWTREGLDFVKINDIDKDIYFV